MIYARPTLVLVALAIGCTGEKPAGDDTGPDPATLDEDGDGSVAADDCNDADAAIFPGADELCNDLDDDCDGLADEDAVDQLTRYGDSDGDGAGDPEDVIQSCDPADSTVETGDDCDDTDPAVNPSATEVCDAADVDEDCSGAADDQDDGVDLSAGTTLYADVDEDGFGDAASSIVACDAVDGYVEDDTDCDDVSADVNPDAAEVCDESDTDEDCSGAADDLDAAVDTSTGSTWYVDADGDGFGDPDSSMDACDLPAGYVADATDCDDSESTINPSATEACDASDTDEDCDGAADNDQPGADGETTWYADADGDGFGDASTSTAACDQPDAYVADATDCDDASGMVYPAAAEFCDGIANDCDTASAWTVDLEAGTATWVDADGVASAVTDTLAAGTEEAPVTWTAPADGELTLCDGTFYALLDGSGVNLAITGLNGSDSTRLDAAGAGTVLSFTGATLSVEGVTVTNGSGSSGGGLYCLATDLTITDAVFHDNTATSSGGGVFLQSCTDAVLTDVDIFDNAAASGGGLYATNSSGLVAEGLQITGNTSSATGGGATLSRSDFSVTDSTISDNAAGGSYSGGGLSVGSSTGTFDAVTISGNTAFTAAGLVVSDSTVDVIDSTVSDNEAGSYGGAVHIYYSSTFTMTGSTVSGNESEGEAPVYIDNNSAGSFTTCVFSANVGEVSGVFAFANTASATIVSSDFSGNQPNDAYAFGTAYTFGMAASATCDDVTGCY